MAGSDGGSPLFAEPHRRWDPLRGDWVLANYAAIGRQVREVRLLVPDPAGVADLRIDAQGLGALDTAGASRLCDLLGRDLARTLSAPGSALPAERRALLETVVQAGGEPDAPPARHSSLATELLGRVGVAAEAVGRNIAGLLGFMGLVLGSTTDQVVRHAHCPVVVVPPSEHDHGPADLDALARSSHD